MIIYPNAKTLFSIQMLADPWLEYWVLDCATVSAYLHLVLLAANRSCSMLFPLSYESLWTRSTSYISVVAGGW
jgi:hypothetical protein